MTTNIESWFIPFDIVMIVCSVFAVILAMLFLIIIILDKTCHTVSMMLVANSCLAELAFGSISISMAIFTLQNDIKQIQYQDSLCVFRGFMGYVVAALQFYSFLLQAIYRYIIVIYPTRLFWQSTRFQVLLMSITWIFGFVCPLPHILTHAITYNVDNQFCQMPLRLSFLTVYNALFVCVVPVSLTMLIYFRLVRYVREMSRHIISANTLFRAQRELKMVRRIVILVIGVVTLGFPYVLFTFISFFTTPPKYHFRIAYIFADASMAYVMIALFQFTDPLKEYVKKIIHGRSNAVIPTMT
ncbi:unnamed protein product [Adineta steineri]|uniref:G-protein coupled receptors family 1 profile domain-containing protein n=1 Tax=Adineta steineri TaxID=433720 RepID=A0A816DEP4_9BILA|nr:unnamed protein product [Adineta steineri]CAF1635375.1 unnamed protein product [Adineta steineri]